MATMGQDQKGRLERILRIGRIVQDSQTHIEDHAGMSFHQSHEGLLIALRQIPTEKDHVRLRAARRILAKPTQKAKQRLLFSLCHEVTQW